MNNEEAKVLYTKWGKAQVNSHGYYVITTRKEGFNKKSLHRLIYEAYYGRIPDGCVIHHRNENKLDNKICNLELMSEFDHNSLHTTGENNPMFGKTHTESTKRNMSKSKNSSGFRNVYKHKCEKCRQDFRWVYRYYDENGKRKAITSVSIEKLKEKVLKRGLPWEEFKKRSD